jgi:hypothetical protein
VLSDHRLAVRVMDANATYPVRIDPTFSDANWVSLNPGLRMGMFSFLLTDAPKDVHEAALEMPKSGNAANQSTAAGNSRTKVAPCPRRLSQRTVPDIRSARRFTMDRPRPLEDSPPVGRALNRMNFPNIFFKSSSLIPGPSSRMANNAFGPFVVASNEQSSWPAKI